MANFICSYTDAGKSFNMVTYFVKKVERMRKARQAKDLAKRPKITSNFQGFYFGGQVSRSLLPASAINHFYYYIWVL